MRSEDATSRRVRRYNTPLPERKQKDDARVGVSKVTVIAIEHGRVTAIKRRTMRRLAAALEVEPADVAEFRRALSGNAPAHED